MIVVLTWVWQGLAIALATVALLASTRRLSAATRHATWWLACTAVVALPAAYLLTARPPAPLAATTVPSPVLVPEPPDALLSIAPLAWAVLALLGLLRVAWSLQTVSRLKRSGEPCDSLARAWESTPWNGGAPEVRVSDEVTGACALGLGRPVILVSRTLVDALPRRELDAILLHERAHLERHDDWWQLLQAIVGAVAGWHPAIWFIGRQISFEREAACDDRVLVRTGSARDYARALVRVAESRSASRPRLDSVVIPGAAASVPALRRRVRLLLDARVNRAARPALVASVLMATALVGAVLAAARIPGVFVLVDAPTSLPHVEATRARGTPALELPRTIVQRAAATVTAGTRNPTVTAEARPRVVLPASAATARTIAHPVAETRDPVPATGIASVLAPPPQHGPTAGPGGGDLAAPPLPSRATPWSSLAGSGTSAGRALASTAAVTADRTRDAGRSIGRFFTKAASGIAGSF